MDPEAKATAQLKSREACVVAGLDVLEFCFAELSQEIVVEINVQDGDGIQPDTVLATIHGPAQAILTGERTALNFMQRLCGIATQTSHYVQAIITGSKTKILDTRKTTPGLRFSEKYAVACGGGTNHRMALYDRVMMKDNHRFLAGQKGPCSISKAIRASRAAFPNLEVEVEVESFDELKEALEGKADQIMLDNMSNKQIEKAIEIKIGFMHAVRTYECIFGSP